MDLEKRIQEERAAWRQEGFVMACGTMHMLYSELIDSAFSAQPEKWEPWRRQMLGHSTALGFLLLAHRFAFDALGELSLEEKKMLKEWVAGSLKGADIILRLDGEEDT